MKNTTSPLITILVLLTVLSCSTSERKYTSWKTYNGGKESLKYSSLTQINTTNVDQLQLAWTYNTGDADSEHHSQIQCNPIIVEVFCLE